MSAEKPKWMKVARLDELPAGEARAVNMGEGRSIALFNQDGKIYATDNQCPHMGYPLTRGVVRSGVLTCDWHGRRFDLEGGGCFNNLCDDLETFPVDIRGEEIWIEAGYAQYQRRTQHLDLLWEGLLHGDHWTMSKAIALLLKGGVPEAEIVEVIIRHVGRHIASSHGAEGGEDVARLINGLKVGQQYDGEDRLIALTTAASAAAGGAAERLEVIPLSGTVPWEKIDGWVRAFSRDGQSGRIERCLFTAYSQGDQDKILPLLFECAVEPNFVGFNDNVISLAYLAEIVDVFDWQESSELVLNLGAKLVGRGRGEPDLFRRDAIKKMQGMVDAGQTLLTDSENGDSWDEDAFVGGLSSVDLERSFDGVGTALKSGAGLDRIISSLVLLAADRMARTPVNVDAGWPNLTTELNLAASLRTARRCGGDQVAAKGVFHVAWQLFTDRWLNIPARPLAEPLADVVLDVADEDAGVERIIKSIKTLDVHGVGDQVLGYLNAGYSGTRLLLEMGRAVLWDDTGRQLLPTLRTVFQEWEYAQQPNAAEALHPARFQLLVALARYATDIRTNKESGAAATTAVRFAEGRTTVEVFDE